MFAVMGMEGRIEEGLGQPHSGTLSAVIVYCRIVNTWFSNSECVKGWQSLTQEQTMVTNRHMVMATQIACLKEGGRG